MALEYSNVCLAAGSVVGATGAENWASGAVAARTAKGTYTLTMDQPIDATECAVLVTGRGATAAIFTVTQTSDGVKTVTAFDAAGAALDADFDFLVVQAPSS